MTVRGNICMLLMAAAGISGCGLFDNGPADADEQALAKAYGKELFLSDIPADILKKAVGVDSLPLLKTYSSNWLSQQVLLQKAMEAPGNMAELEKKVTDYRNSLLVYEYEKQLITRELDTAVTAAEIVTYYQNNQSNFELKKNIVRLRYVKIPNEGVPDREKAKKWFISGQEDDRQKLLEYCSKYASNAFFDEETWLTFDDLLKEIPIKNYDDETFLQNNRFVELKDGDYTYWVFIRAFRIKNSTSPLEVEQGNIRNIIINKRKIKLLQEMERSLLQKARDQKDITSFIE